VSAVEINERVPGLSDKQLESLHANALRLASRGTPKQQQQAEELLPLLQTEMEQRKIAKTAVQADKRKAAVRAPAPRKAKSKPAREEVE
jgi:hypothetical protein